MPYFHLAGEGSASTHGSCIQWSPSPDGSRLQLADHFLHRNYISDRNQKTLRRNRNTRFLSESTTCDRQSQTIERFPHPVFADRTQDKSTFRLMVQPEPKVLTTPGKTPLAEPHKPERRNSFASYQSGQRPGFIRGGVLVEAAGRSSLETQIRGSSGADSGPIPPSAGGIYGRQTRFHLRRQS